MTERERLPEARSRVTRSQWEPDEGAEEAACKGRGGISRS